jgi:hypothetical protein
MISLNSVVYAFIISFISLIMLKGYAKMYYKDYETDEYVKIFLIVLLSSIFTSYIKLLINPLLSSIIGTKINNINSSSNIQPSNFKIPMSPSSIPNMNNYMNFNPTGMPFNINKPMF